MTRRSVQRTWVPSSGAFLAVVLALCLAGAAAAQSQLPGTPLTNDPANDLRPAWSPDGTTIAYHSTRSGNNEVWLMDADGGNQRQLTNDAADDRRPAWSPDGAWIAFDSDRSGAGNRDIWVTDATGGNLKQVTSGPSLDTFAAWSPDATRLAFFSYQGGIMDLWVVDVQGLLEGGEAGEPQRLTNSLADEKRNQCTFACHMPSWSPDSNRIAYPAMNHTQVWTVDADGSNARQVSGGGTYEHFPTWTPDGKILFLSEHVTEQQEPVNDVWIIDADGSNAAVLYENIPHGGPFEFRPDGATIAFHSPRAGNFDIYTTVLGQEASTPQPFVATPVANLVLEATTVPAAQPTTVTGATPAGEPARSSFLAVTVAVAILVLGGAGIAVFFLRKGRAA
jgi:Tol biopolymer transport system component